MPYDLHSPFGIIPGQISPAEAQMNALRALMGRGDAPNNGAALDAAKNAGDLDQDPHFASWRADDAARAKAAGTPVSGTMPKLQDGEYGTASYFNKRMRDDADTELAQQKAEQGQLDVNTARAKAGANGVPLPVRKQGRGFAEAEGKDRITLQEGGLPGGAAVDPVAEAVRPQDLNPAQYRAVLGGSDPTEVAKLPAQVQMGELEAAAKGREGDVGTAATGIALYGAAASQVMSDLESLRQFVDDNGISIAGNMPELEQRVNAVRARLNALSPSKGARAQIELDIKKTLQDALEANGMMFGKQAVQNRYGLIGSEPNGENPTDPMMAGGR